MASGRFGWSMIVGVVSPVTIGAAFGTAVFLVGAHAMSGSDEAARGGALAASNCHRAPVRPVEDAGIRGGARLCLSARGVYAVMEAERLRVGDTYAVWLSYLDQAGSRFDLPLGEPLDERPGRFSARLDGGIARTSDGYFSGEIPGLELPASVQVTLGLFEHTANSPDRLRPGPRGLLAPLSFAPGVTAITTGDGDGVGSYVAYAAFRLADE